MMKGSDKAKYGSLMKGLVSQYSMKNDQYPKTMTDALDIMSKHSFDDDYYERKKRVRDKRRNEEEQHQQQHNQQQQQQQFSQTKKEYRCYICGDRTHSISDCPQAGKPRAEWFVTKAINKIQHSQREEEDKDDDTDENKERGRSRSATPHRHRRTSRGQQRLSLIHI